MLDDLYQDGTDAAIKDMALRPVAPKPQQAPRFSVWGTLGAAPKGVAAGAADAAGSTADLLGAFGQTMGAMGDSGRGMFSLQTEDERKQAREATDKMRRQGVDFASEAGRSFRNVSASYLPDPVTSHAAEQMVGNLFRVGAKAVAGGMLLGPVPGALAVGAEEGFTEADKLAQQGVDLATRTKVGAITAGATALGLALPVAGQTLKGTVALAAAGGPGTFVAQNAATRYVLEQADYTKQAEQYDPFDPVGLALSTVLPLGFGLLARRGMAAKNGKPAPVAAEVEDAARVQLLREQADGQRLTPPEDMAGAVAHDTAVARAGEQIAAGERVHVADVPNLRAMPEPPAPEAFRVAAQQIEALTAERAALLPDAGKLAEPGDIAATRAELASMEQTRPDTSPEAIKALAKEVQARDGVSYKTAPADARKTVEAQAQDFEARTQRLSQAIETNAQAAKASERLAAIDAQIQDLQRTQAQSAPFPAFRTAVADAARQAVNDPAIAPLLKRRTTVEPTNAPRTPKAPSPEAAAPARSSGAASAEAAPVSSTGRAGDVQASGVKAAASESPALDAATAELETLTPGMPVQLDGMDAPVTLRELMAQVRAEAAQDMERGPLVQAAAACFLRAGM